MKLGCGRGVIVLMCSMGTKFRNTSFTNMSFETIRQTDTHTHRHDIPMAYLCKPALWMRFETFRVSVKKKEFVVQCLRYKILISAGLLQTL